MPRKVRAGFTLFELLLVMLLIVIMYGLFVQNFSLKSKADESIKLEKLNVYLGEVFAQSQERISLRCFDDCGKCQIFKGHVNTNQTISVFERGSSVSAYIFDGKRLEKKEFDDYYADDYKRERVCFALNIYPNGSSDKIVFEYNSKVYLFENYMEEGKVFDTLSQAQEYLQKQQLEVRG